MQIWARKIEVYQVKREFIKREKPKQDRMTASWQYNNSSEQFRKLHMPPGTPNSLLVLGIESLPVDAAAVHLDPVRSAREKRWQD